MMGNTRTLLFTPQQGEDRRQNLRRVSKYFEEFQACTTTMTNNEKLEYSVC